MEPAATGRDLELAGLGPIVIQHRPHAQALQQTAASDVFSQSLDGHASLDVLHIGLAQHQLVERDIPRRGQGDFPDSFCHQFFSTTGAGSDSPDLTSRRPQTNTLLARTAVLDRGQEVHEGESCVRRTLLK